MVGSSWAGPYPVGPYCVGPYCVGPYSADPCRAGSYPADPLDIVDSFADDPCLPQLDVA